MFQWKSKVKLRNQFQTSDYITILFSINTLPFYQKRVRPPHLLPLSIEKRQNRVPIHMGRSLNTGHIEKRRCQIDIQHDIIYHSSGLDARPPQQERHPYVELEGETLPLDQPKLSEVITVIRRVYYVGVIEFSEFVQFIYDPLHSRIHRLQGLQTLRHEEIGELFVNRLHLLGYLEDPLFVWVWSVVVRRSAEIMRKGVICFWFWFLFVKNVVLY